MRPGQQGVVGLAALAALLWPSSAWALPPQAVGALGAAVLPLIVAGAALLGLLVDHLLRGRLRHWRRGFVIAAPVIATLVIIAVQQQGRWNQRMAQWSEVRAQQEHFERVYPDEAGRLLDDGDLLFVDLRRPEDFRLGHLRGAVNLPAMAGPQRHDDSWKVAAELVRMEMARRDPPARKVALYCYSGESSSPALAAALAALEVPAALLFGGDAALAEVGAPRSFGPDGLTLNDSVQGVSPARAEALDARGLGHLVRVDLRRITRWLRSAQTLPDDLLEIRDRRPHTLMLVQPDLELTAEVHRVAYADMSARALRALGFPRVVWVSEGVVPAGDLERLAQKIGLSFEHALGGMWWWLFAALLAAGNAWRARRTLRRRLTDATARPALWSAVLPSVLGLFIVEALWGGTSAGVFSPTLASAPFAQRVATHALLAGGLLVHLVWPAELRGARIVRGLRDRVRRPPALIAADRPALPPRWRWWFPAAALALPAAAESFAPAAAWCTAVLLWSAPLAELLSLRMQPADPAALGVRLLRLAGLLRRSAVGAAVQLAGDLEDAGRIRIQPPQGEPRSVGRLTGSGGEPGDPALAWLLLRCEIALGCDLEISASPDGTHATSMRLVEIGDDAQAALRAQLRAVAEHSAPWLPGRLDSVPRPLDASRFAEATPAPSPLSFRILAARSSPEGAAGQALRQLGLRPQLAPVLRVGTRPYAVSRPAGRAPHALARRVSRLFASVAARRFQEQVVPDALARMRATTAPGAPPQALRRALQQLPHSAALFAEQLALSMALSPKPDTPRSSAGALALAASEPYAPYELRPAGASEAALLPLPTTGLDTDAALLRQATRGLYLRELASVGQRLAHLPTGDALFDIDADALDRALEGTAPDLQSAGLARDALGELSALRLPAQPSWQALESGTTADAQTQLRGTVIAGALPVRGLVHHLDHVQPRRPHSAEVVVAARIAPRALVGLRGAAGLVLEEGGMLSHAAILARELSLPAIFEAASATALDSGTPIELSPSGEITVHTAPASESPCPLAQAPWLAEAGPKSWNLARMAAAELPVAPGFVLAPTLVEGLLAAGTVDPELWSTLQAIAGDAGLILRSSASDEDGAGSSQAGLFESRGELRGPEELKAALEACTELAGGRAIAYLVQPQLRLKLGGVLFTRSARGPLVEFSTDGPTAVVAGAAGVQRALLSDPPAALGPWVETLREYGRRCEALFGGPQDIEWGVDRADKLWLLQSRPITA